MKSRHYFLFLLVLAVGLGGCKACSCKRSPKIKTETKKEIVEKEPWEEGGTYLKWILSLSEGQVSTVSLEKIDSSSGLIPHLGGDYLAIVYSGGKKVAAFPVQFPSKWREVRMDEQGRRTFSEGTIEGERRTVAWIRLDQPVDKLSLMNPEGQEVLETTALSNGEMLSSIPIVVPPKEVKPAPAQPIKKKKKTWGCDLLAESSEEPPIYRHVRLITPGDLEMLNPGIQGIVAEILIPAEPWKDMLREALAAASPSTLSGVTHIGFVRFAGEDAQVSSASRRIAFQQGSLLFLSSIIAENDFHGTVIHEVAHTYEELLEGAVAIHTTGERASQRWDQQTRSLATRTLNRFGSFAALYGFDNLWKTIQQEGIRHHLTVDYLEMGFEQYRDNPSDPGGNSWAATHGFADPYGAYDFHEDIGTYVERVQASGFAREAKVCGDLRTIRDVFRLQSILLPYVKILLLKNAGFITEGKARACYGDLVLRGDRGIHFFAEGLNNPTLSFTSNVKAGYQRDGDYHYFNVLGDGPDTRQILIQVLLDRGRLRRSTPIGLYRLNSINMATVNIKGLNGVYLAHRDNMKARGSASGLVLISEYTNDPMRVEGAVFFLALQNAGGGTILEGGGMMTTPLGLPIPIPPGGTTDYFPLVTFQYER